MNFPVNPLVGHETIIDGEILEHLAGAGLCELVEGRIVPMTPTGWEHGRLERRVALALQRFIDEQGSLVEVLVGEVGIYTRRRPDTVRAADVVLISRERLATNAKHSRFLTVAPELVIEILSPDDRATDVTQKVLEYLEAGATAVCLIDPPARRVRVHRKREGMVELTDADTLALPDLLPGFSHPVARLFD